MALFKCCNCGQPNKISDVHTLGQIYKCTRCGTSVALQGESKLKGFIQYNPKTYIIVSEQGQKIERPTIFEPALIPQKHLRGAFRLGDPMFQDPEIRTQWLNIRRQVMDYLLQTISCSIWKDHLVLRGSLLLKAWLGDLAREPGDIDWVFRPYDINVNSDLSQELFSGLIEMVSKHPQVGNAIIEVDKIAITDIWTYERASGRRIIFPWKTDDFPSGDLHMDVVFNEELLSDPIQVYIPSSIGESRLVWAASKELSLAWKLLWLETDTYPQGKDLYDATLLAEQTSLSFDILYQVLQSSEDWKSQAALKTDFSWKSGFPWTESEYSAYLDWDNFKLEYPGIEGDVKDWQARLSLALAPTFVNLDD